ncbi:MAG TPA: MBL fold metallo-hydrolase [Bryobacteraceae bacterium]|jgi:phosphoribosyl 1,2-cyclic phosphate phosphodiesterase|nr:MBL fold metallo-hydrolase [Bryobacteraceae bacterium]
MKITVLGSGTSSGVPTIGCSCAVCRSSDPRDKRLRPSILISRESRNIVIDTTPDFRAQVLRAGIERLDAIVYTHAHADHIFGLDDVRPFNYHQGKKIPIYASRPTFATIERVFAYVFDNRDRKTHVPQLEVNLIDETPFDVWGLSFTPIPLMHGKDPIFGFRFADVAYLTDHSEIPESSLQMLGGLDVLFLDALRPRPHPTHSTLEKSIETARKLRPRRTFFTHMCHDVGHAATEALLPADIHLAYDGLEITVPSA